MSNITSSVDNATDGLWILNGKLYGFDGVQEAKSGYTAFYGSQRNELYSEPNMKRMNRVDKLAVGELFGAFFYKRVDQETNSYNMDNNNMSRVKPYTVPWRTKEYYKFLESGQDIKTIYRTLKGKISRRISNRISRLPNARLIPKLAYVFHDREDVVHAQSEVGTGIILRLLPVVCMTFNTAP